MRRLEDGNGTTHEMGIVLRAQLSAMDKARYACMWSFDSKALTLTSDQVSTPLATKMVNEAGAPIPLTMEARVVGTTLACCIREFPSASITGMSTDVAAGYPGVQTSRMRAGFGSFAVTQP